MKVREKRLPTIPEAFVFLILVIAVIITGIRMKIGPQNALFYGTLVATLIAFYLGNKWNDIQEAMMNTIKGSLIAVLIIIIVGMMIGVWLIGGTVPALVYYGLKLISPAIMLPLTFILCSITSLFTGTSFGTMATMGLALVGVSVGLGMPTHIVAGAAVSGAYFGDKMSPLSDTTNMASGMTGTPLYSHVFSMFYTTVPATILCIVLYTVLGLRYSGGSLDPGNITVMTETLGKQFNLSLLTLLPPLLVLIISAKQTPAIPGLSLTLLVSIFLAMFLQDKNFVQVMQVAFNGFRSETGVKVVDTLLSRGGVRSVQDTVTLIILACMMGGALNESGVLTVFVQGLFKIIKKPSGLVVGTMVYSYSILALSGNQVLGIILGSGTFKDAYQKMNVHSRVLSRTLEDTNTIGAPIIPWSTACLYACAVMGVTTDYIPYVFLTFTVPIFSLVCAFTGWGMFNADGSPKWKKKGSK